MRKYTPRQTVPPFIRLALLAVLVIACSSCVSKFDAALERKLGLFQRLQGNLAEQVAARVQKMPTYLLKATQDYDRSIGITNADHYTARTATDEELALINSYIELLPRAHQTVFSRKLLAVYLIDGFSGAGLTDWVVDSRNSTYYYLILNSSLFTTSLDDWLTYKANSVFDKSAALPTMRVRTQTDFKALMYGLLHEGAHIVDYELGVTPYIDPMHRQLSGRTQESTPFIDEVWVQQTQPRAQYDFKHRAALNLYGTFPKMGLIPRSQLSEMFAQLTRTPFGSFYSGSSWNEHLANYVTYHHIEKKLNGAVTVELLRIGNVVDRYEPVKTPLAQQREKTIRAFYD